jgi:hypothetical protein
LNPRRILLLALIELALEQAQEHHRERDEGEGELVRALGMALIAAAHLEGDEGENEPSSET